eukprot:9476016-Pyramimonas_sp.AAC.1
MHRRAPGAVQTLEQGLDALARARQSQGHGAPPPRGILDRAARRVERLPRPSPHPRARAPRRPAPPRSGRSPPARQRREPPSDPARQA